MKKTLILIVLVLLAGLVYADTVSYPPSAVQSTDLKKVAGATVATGHGAASGAIRVEIANDSTAVLGATQSGTWNVNVSDGSGALNVIVDSGTLAATQSGNWTSRVVGNAGATLDGTIGVGTAPTNMLVGGAVYESNILSLSDGQSAALQSTFDGTLRIAIGDGEGLGRLADVDNQGQLEVIAALTAGGIGAGSAEIAENEDVAGNTGDRGVKVLGRANEALTTQGADGDYGFPALDTKGRVIVTGQVAADAAVAGNPVTVGVRAAQGDPTAVTAGDAVHPLADLLGKLVMMPHAVPQRTLEGNTTHSSTTGAQTIRGAQGSGIRNYVAWFNCCNSSATFTRVTITDGTNSLTFGVPAANCNGQALPIPYRGLADTAITAATTDSVATVYCAWGCFDQAN